MQYIFGYSFINKNNFTKIIDVKSKYYQKNEPNCINNRTNLF